MGDFVLSSDNSIVLTTREWEYLEARSQDMWGLSLLHGNKNKELVELINWEEVLRWVSQDSRLL